MEIAFAATLLAGLATTIGILLARTRQPWLDARRGEFTGFAGGVLTAVAVVRLLPEAELHYAHAPFGALAGFLLMLAFSHMLANREPHPEAAARRTVVPLAGIAIHSFLDGVVLSTAFVTNPVLGVFTATGLVLHELPEGVLTYGLLRCGSVPDRRAIVLALLGAALTTPLGTLVSWPVVAHLSPALLGVLLSLSAGMLLHVGATHLIPEAEAGARATLAVFAGAGLIVVASVFA